MRRTHLLFALLLLGIATLVTAATWIRDDLGGPAPPCYYTDATGNVVACTAINRLPVDILPTSGMAPTTPTTELSGWAMNWLGSSVPDATNNLTLAPWAVSDNLYYGFQVAQVGMTIDVLTSHDKGRTWLNRQTFNVGGLQWNQFGAAYRLTSGSWLLGGTTGAGLTPANTGLITWLSSGALSQVALPGVPNGVAGGVSSIYQQGTTVLASYIITAGSNLYACRSTNSGVSFACTTIGETATVVGGKIIDSPAPGIWLLGKGTGGGGILRSTDDGVSWTSVLATGAGTAQVIECISSTVCLFTNGGASIWRSSDAGASWTMVFTPPTLSPLFQAFVDYGNGVVAALPSAQDRDIWLSRDSGVNWTPVFHLAGGAQRTATPYQTTQSGGSAVFSSQPLAWTDKAMYSPSIGAGQTQIVGATNTPLAIDTAGRIVANQGTSAGVTGPWSFYVSDGAVSRGIGVNSLLTSPVQGATLLNSQSVSAANTAITITLTGAANTRVHLYAMAGFCSAEDALIQVMDGAAVLWTSPDGTVGTLPYTVTWPVGLTGTTAGNMTVTLGSCGPGNVGTLSVQADRF
jgi:hypothetical protein